MKKIAFFVEGKTEQLFLESFLLEIFNKNEITIEKVKITGGSSTQLNIKTINAIDLKIKTQYYILIYDVGGENNIKSYILNRRETLLKSGYSIIIGIRDVFPKFERKDIQKLLDNLYFKTPQNELPIKFILQIMEIEAWFLAETSHFQKINKRLTVDLIHKKLLFNPIMDNMEERNNPASDLSNCYKLVGLNYSKKQRSVNRTLLSLDFAELYLNIPSRVKSLRDLVDTIDEFIK